MTLTPDPRPQLPVHADARIEWQGQHHRYTFTTSNPAEWIVRRLHNPEYAGFLTRTDPDRDAFHYSFTDVEPPYKGTAVGRLEDILETFE